MSSTGGEGTVVPLTDRRLRRHIRTAACAAAFALSASGCALPDSDTGGPVAVQAETGTGGRVVEDSGAWGGKVLELDAGAAGRLDPPADAAVLVARARALCDTAELQTTWRGAGPAAAPLGGGWVDVQLPGRPAAAGTEPLELVAAGCAVQIDYVAGRTVANPLSGHTQWANSDGRLYDAATQLRADGRDGDAALLDALADVPTAMWLGDWLDDPARAVGRALADARRAGQVPVFVLYNIPERDCGGFSAQHAGAPDSDEYLKFVGNVARVLRGRLSVVVVEPDAMSQECPDRVDHAGRAALIAQAVELLAAAGGPVVYLDAGHAGWLDIDDQAARLREAGIANAHGFALNVSNFRSVSESVRYAEDLSGAVGGKPFVLDTSRAGGGSTEGEFCNPGGVALGPAPTFAPPSPLADAWLWVKRPAESDGHCDGAPPAGELHIDALLDMAARAGFPPAA